MANSESSTDTQKYTLVSRDWNLSDEKIIEKIDGIIQALNNKEIDAATILNGMDLGDANASIHIFGRDGNYFCSQRLIWKWLYLLVALASSENVTGKSIARTFTRSCGGCMVYTILMVVACFSGQKNARLAFEFFRDRENARLAFEFFRDRENAGLPFDSFRDQENARLAFDFFRHVLADPEGQILELGEISKLAQLLFQHVPRRRDGTFMRSVCLEIRHNAHYIDKTTSEGQIVVGLRDLIEGLGGLCTSESFIKAMKENSASTIEIVKESIKNKTFSREFVEEKWQ